jgi:hypothetical protein
LNQNKAEKLGEARGLEERDLSAHLAAYASRLTNYMADRRGMPMLVGFLMVLLNFVLQFFPSLGWLIEYDVFLHAGVLLAIAGSLLASAL